jgi:hypothetical protein
MHAQVIFVCDAHDAMTSERGYCAAVTAQEAVAELRRCSGTQFSPRIVEASAGSTRARGGRSDRNLRRPVGRCTLAELARRRGNQHHLAKISPLGDEAVGRRGLVEVEGPRDHGTDRPGLDQLRQRA